MLSHARFPVLTSYYREDEPVSPTQTVLLKLLDSFLNPVPTPFRGRHDHLNNLTGFLATVFLFQAKHAQHVIQHATGEPPPGENIVTDVGVAASCALDGRLPGVWVALVLLSTSLSSLLLAEQEDHSGANTDPGVVVTLTHLCHDAISASRSSTGTGFIEELVGMMVPRSASYLLQRQTFTPSQKPCVYSTSFSHVSILGGGSGHPREGEKLFGLFLTEKRRMLPTFLTSNETW
jgi:hypothetical protein